MWVHQSPLIQNNSVVVFERLEPNEMDEGCIVMNDPEGNEFCLD